MSEIKAATGVLQANSLRQFMVYLVPGVLLVYPYYKVLLAYYPDLDAFVPATDWARAIMIFGFGLFAGFLLENVGSRIEIIFDNSIGDLEEYWNKYLATAFIEEPVGQRYMRDILTRMKFELNAGVTLLLVWPSFWFAMLPTTGWCIPLILSLVALGLSGWLLYEAHSSHALLHTTRKLICDGIYVVPAQSDKAKR